MKNNKNFESLILDIKEKANKINEFIFNNLEFDNNLKNLYESAFYYLKSGGKKIRPYLVIKSGELFGLEDKLALPTAATIEMIHNFTLIHDDIMDNSDFRHHLPSAHKKYGLDYGILGGDFLLIYALNFLTEKNKDLGFDYNKILSINKNILQTCIEICEGQALDSDFSKNYKIPSKKDYFLMISKKTSSLISTSCFLGGLIVDAELKYLKKLKNYGKYLGIAFQIIDDLLGVLGESEKTGKPVGNDIIEGKKTLPIILAYRFSNKKEKERIISILSSKKANTEDINFIVKILKRLEIENKLRNLANKYLNKSIKEISNIKGDKKSKSNLIELAYFIIERNF